MPDTEASQVRGERVAAASPADRSRPSPRWPWLWQGFSALLLVIVTAIAGVRAPDLGHWLATAAIAAGLAAWHGLVVALRQAWEGRPRILIWLAGVLVFLAVLIDREPSFFFLVYALFPQIFGLMGRWAVPGAAALVLVTFWRTGAFQGPPGMDLLEVAGSVALAIMVGWFVTALVNESAKKEQALEALQAARSKLEETSRRAGVLEERQRLAREIHDTVAQSFTGMVMQLEATEQAIDADPRTARVHLDRARRSARDSLGEMRRSVQALRPEALERGSLAEAVQRTVQRWSEETGTEATTAAVGAALPLRTDAEIALLRTVQEALVNVAKHAGAGRVDVRLEYSDTGVALRVTDDGIGFVPGTAAGDGSLGLTGMRERLASVGGRLLVDSEPGRGTRVVATAPSR